MPRATMAVANMIPIIVIVVGIYTSVSQAEPCSWLYDYNRTCIDKFECLDTEVNIDIWENCEKDSWLFTKNDNQTFTDGCDPFTLNGNNVILKKSLDAEGINEQYCYIIEKIYTTITSLDIDEFQPKASIESIHTVDNFKETDDLGMELLRFSVTDDDRGETASISMTDDNEDNEDNGAFQFSSEIVGESKEFVITNIIPIDFEKKQYYNLKYILQSFDKSGYSSGTVKHEVNVFVQDVNDNPPFWVQTMPSLNLEECDAETTAFNVTAQDRDMTIDNNITYSITKGNDEGYFSIDPGTGVVKTLKDIDRENITTTTFALTIKATEIPGEPSVNGKDSNTQVTNIYISDINDNSPKFNKENYEFEMDELSEWDFDLNDLTIFVVDMDEGDNGTYTVTTSNNDQLKVITPGGGEGRLNSSVTLRAIKGYFDYEKQETLEFTLTATEKADSSHESTATLKITLHDINDNKPKFDKPNYTATINETEQEGFPVITVTATDADNNETFGNSSIRYYFQGHCQELKIDEITGEVTVSSSRFNYEDRSTVTCNVQAKDTNGIGESSDVELIITVNDVADGVPNLSLTNEVTEIAENKTKEKKLCDLMAYDEDASANITFTIDWNKSDPNIVEIQDWFDIPAATKDGLNFTSQVIALPFKLDRDVLEKNQISLRIVATDEASGKTNTNLEDLIFIITDINDCWPEFSDFQNDSEIKEYFNDMSPGCRDGDVITNIVATDKDENPTISFSLLSPSEYVEVNSTGHIIVKNAASIDRETVPEFEVDIIIKDDEGKHNNTQKLRVKVLDLNDNTPTFNMSICNIQYSVSEDAEDGTPITTVIADDLDEGLQGQPLYRLLNIETNYRTPFIIDKETGNITTFNSSERYLNREETPFWNLKIRAQDQCKYNNFDCEVLQTNLTTDCTINVTVLDVNDCQPDNFKIVKGDNIVDKIIVSESDKAEHYLGYEIRATDDDEPGTANSTITYNVTGIYLDSEQNELFPNITFIAETSNRSNTQTGNMEYYCRLRSAGNLTHLRGDYYIVIEATDGGEEPLSNSITWDLVVTDANDYPPEFDFRIGCSNNTFIKMEENNIINDWLNCSTGTDDDFTFKMNDDDWDDKNQEVEVKILKENSTTSPNATQLGAFKIQKENKMYRINVTEKINREQGSWYNLAIHAQDCVFCNSDEPKLEQVHYLMIRITNVFEFLPIFKESSNCNSNMTKCEQVVYIPENAKGEAAEADFMEAYDEDNISGDESHETQPVYYRIVDVYPNDGKIEFKDQDDENHVIVAENLNREIIANYTVTIDTYNDNPYNPPQPLNQPQRNRLFLTVMVRDKYDNPPEFNNTNNVTFGSFMPTDDTGKEILTIEAVDVDLNETLRYSISGNFTWPESEPPQNTEQPFKFIEEQPEGNKKSKLLLNFNPKGQRGFCTFPITVTDEGNMTCVTEVKIFSITEDLQVPFYYENTTSELQAIQDKLQASLSLVFELKCEIDNIEQPAGKHTRAESDGLNIVMTHFINRTLNTVVQKHIIERMATSEKVFELTKSMEALHLELRRIGDTTTQPPPNSQLYMILLGVALGIVSLMLVLLGFAYHRSTTNLKRQVKAMSATTFGSVSSEINRIGVDSAPVPGSNQFTGEGANPMFNLENFTIKEDDTSSVGSGDSVLVGVEDTEDFRNYGRGKGRAPQPPGKRLAPAAPLEKGLDNPAFTGRSIDQVTATAPPSAFDSTTRINPLLQLGEETDLADSLADYQFTVTRRTSSDMEDDNPAVSALNSNFSFN